MIELINRLEALAIENQKLRDEIAEYKNNETVAETYEKERRLLHTIQQNCYYDACRDKLVIDYDDRDAAFMAWYESKRK